MHVLPRAKLAPVLLTQLPLAAATTCHACCLNVTTGCTCTPSAPGATSAATCAEGVAECSCAETAVAVVGVGAALGAGEWGLAASAKEGEATGTAGAAAGEGGEPGDAPSHLLCCCCCCWGSSLSPCSCCSAPSLCSCCLRRLLSCCCSCPGFAPWLMTTLLERLVAALFWLVAGAPCAPCSCRPPPVLTCALMPPAVPVLTPVLTLKAPVPVAPFEKAILINVL